jgi:hypothetical protein
MALSQESLDLLTSKLHQLKKERKAITEQLQNASSLKDRLSAEKAVLNTRITQLEADIG